MTDNPLQPHEIVKAITEGVQSALKEQLPCNAENLRITTLETKVANLTVTVDRNTVRIHGNGKEGLEDTALRHDLSIKKLEEFMLEIKKYGSWLILLVAGILITAIINLVLNG